MGQNRTTVLVAALLLVLSAVVPAAATAESTLSVGVDQDAHGDVTVIVTSNGTAVENANVSVDAENATYAGEGEYETDENGTVDLPAPEEDVTVRIDAECDCANGSTTVELLAPSLDVEAEQAADGTAAATVTYAITGEPVENATVNVTTVDANATYAGVGSYETDENGSISLPAPDENVSVQLHAAADDLEGRTTIELLTVTEEEEMADSFGARVSAFVHSLLGGDRDGGIGHLVAEFVLENNPGNAPDHAGPPEDGERGQPDFVEDRGGAGNSTASDAADSGGPSDDARGPPDHANHDGDDRGAAADDDRGNAPDRDDSRDRGKARGR